MSKDRKVQKRAIESKKKLLNSAYILFAEKGYYNTNTKEIVKSAGISIGNFYNYYKDKGDIYCELLEEYCNSSYIIMTEFINKLAMFDNRISCKNFLQENLNILVERFNETNNFFEDSKIISKENTKVQSIISQAEERLISIIEMFLKKRYPNKQEDFYIKARMIYMITDRVAKDISSISSVHQRETYIYLLSDEILHYIFEF